MSYGNLIWTLPNKCSNRTGEVHQHLASLVIRTVDLKIFVIKGLKVKITASYIHRNIPPRWHSSTQLPRNSRPSCSWLSLHTGNMIQYVKLIWVHWLFLHLTIPWSSRNISPEYCCMFQEQTSSPLSTLEIKFWPQINNEQCMVKYKLRETKKILKELEYFTHLAIHVCVLNKSISVHYFTACKGFFFRINCGLHFIFTQDPQDFKQF